MEEADNGWMMIRAGDWVNVFLLVPADAGANNVHMMRHGSLNQRCRQPVGGRHVVDITVVVIA